MSCSINGTTIKLTRGDSLVVKVGMKYKGTCKEYVPEPGDQVRFALKRNALEINQKDFIDKDPLILKNIPISTLILELEPSDTKPLAFGDYIYDIELTHANGRVDTFIEDASFTIGREVH